MAKASSRVSSLSSTPVSLDSDRSSPRGSSRAEQPPSKPLPATRDANGRFLPGLAPRSPGRPKGVLALLKAEAGGDGRELVERLLWVARGFLQRVDPVTGEITWERVSAREVGKAIDSLLDRGVLPRIAIDLTASEEGEASKLDFSKLTYEELKAYSQLMDKISPGRTLPDDGAGEAALQRVITDGVSAEPGKGPDEGDQSD